MISPNIYQTLEGPHYEAFKDFAENSGIKTTRENVRRIIETLPQFQKNTPSVGNDLPKLTNGTEEVKGNIENV